MANDVAGVDVWGVSVDDLSDSEFDVVLSADNGNSQFQARSHEIAKRYRAKYGIPEDEGLCGLFYTGDSDERAGRCETESECVLFGVGKYDIVEFVRRYPDLSKELFFKHDFQWSNWVIGG